MFEKLRRFTSLFLTTALVLLTFAPSAVSASAYTDTEGASANISTPSEAVLYSVRGAQVEEQLCKDLEAFNVSVKDDTLIEIVPFGIQRNANSLVVTNKSGTTVDKTTLTVFGEDGEIKPFSAPGENATRGLGGNGNTIDLFSNESLVIVWSVLFNEVISDGRYCYQPKNAQFVCYNRGGYNVQNIHMEYICQGYECSYPGVVDLGLDFMDHIMEINQDYPTSNLYYVNNNAYRTDRVICVNNRSHIVYVYFTINGRTQYDYMDLKAMRM